MATITPAKQRSAMDEYLLQKSKARASAQRSPLQSALGGASALDRRTPPNYGPEPSQGWYQGTPGQVDGFLRAQQVNENPNAPGRTVPASIPPRGPDSWHEASRWGGQPASGMRPQSAMSMGTSGLPPAPEGYVPGNQLPTYANTLRGPMPTMPQTREERFQENLARFDAPEGTIGLVGTRQNQNPRLKYATIDGKPVLLPPGLSAAPGQSIGQALNEFKANREAERLANRPSDEEMAARRAAYHDRAAARKSAIGESRAVYLGNRLKQEGRPVPGILQEALGNLQNRIREQRPDSGQQSGMNRQQSALWAALLGADPETAQAIMSNPQLQSGLMGQLGAGQVSQEGGMIQSAMRDAVSKKFGDTEAKTIPDVIARNTEAARSAVQMVEQGASIKEVLDQLRQQDQASPPGARNAEAAFRAMMLERSKKANSAYNDAMNGLDSSQVPGIGQTYGM